MQALVRARDEEVDARAGKLDRLGTEARDCVDDEPHVGRAADVGDGRERVEEPRRGLVVDERHRIDRRIGCERLSHGRRLHGLGPGPVDRDARDPMRLCHRVQPVAVDAVADDEQSLPRPDGCDEGELVGCRSRSGHERDAPVRVDTRDLTQTLPYARLEPAVLRFAVADIDPCRRALDAIRGQGGSRVQQDPRSQLAPRAVALVLERREPRGVDDRIGLREPERLARHGVFGDPHHRTGAGLATRDDARRVVREHADAAHIVHVGLAHRREDPEWRHVERADDDRTVGLGVVEEAGLGERDPEEKGPLGGPACGVFSSRGDRHR